MMFSKTEVYFLGLATFIFILSPTLAVNDAQFISQSGPSAMTPGQTYIVSVTMKNSGTTTWTESSGYRLGSQNPQDNWIWGDGRVYLSSGESIVPGQTKTFSFSVKAPSTTGTYNFQWRIVQDGVEWFGNKSANIAVNVIIEKICSAGAINGCQVCKNDGSGWQDRDSECGTGKICLNGGCFAAEIPLAKNSFSYGNFAGANVLQKATRWVPNESETEIIMQSAKKRHLNMLRLNVLPICIDNPDPNCAGLGLEDIKKFLDNAQTNELKVMVELGGYDKYEGKCGWKSGFVDIAEGSKKIVLAFKDHPALFAWSLSGEPLWSADNEGCASAADHESVIKAVYAMHNLVRSVDSKTPLTVGDGKDEYLSVWNKVVNFAKPHIYFAPDYKFTKDEFQNRIKYLKNLAGSLPVVIGEYGIAVPPQTEADRTQLFERMHKAMKEEDIGGMFWLLSTDSDQASMSLINPDGSLKPTANVVVNAAAGQSCIPIQVLGCKVCKADGLGWVDDNSKCAIDQNCYHGSCMVNPQGKMSLACPENCTIGQSGTCTVSNCTSGIFIIKSLVGQPINITKMILNGDFPITFFSRSPYLRAFMPQGNGMVGVLALCLDGFPAVRRANTAVGGASDPGLKQNSQACISNSECQSNRCAEGVVCCNSDQCGWGVENGNPQMCINNGETKANQWLNGVCRNGVWKTVLNGVGCGNPAWACDSGTCQNNFCKEGTASVVCESARPFTGTQNDASVAIQACIDSAVSGSIVEIPAGKYYINGPIYVNKALTLRTEGKTDNSPPCASGENHDCAELIANSNYYTASGMLSIYGSGMKIDHLVINGNKAARWSSRAATSCSSNNAYGFNIAVGCSNCNFTNLVSKNALCGTSFGAGGQNIIVSRNSIVNNGDHCKNMLWSDGITIGDCANCNVTENTFSDNTDIDLIFGGCQNCEIKNNQISHTASANGGAYASLMIHAWTSTSGNYTGTIVSGNTIDCGPSKRCGFGLYLGADAWYITDSYGGSFHDNTITNAQQGVVLDDVHDMEVYNNQVISISGNKYTIGTRSRNIDTSKDTLGTTYTSRNWDRQIPNFGC